MTDLLETMPYKLIAILRGVQPDEIEPIVEGLINIGINSIEIPLNSPNPFQSIEKVAKIAQQQSADSILIGAGTVLNKNNVRNVANASGKLIVSPNVFQEVIEATSHYNMVSLPGVFTASEAHAAIRYGTHMLKFFPASSLNASGIAAIKETLPSDIKICAVGGIGANDFKSYIQKDICYFGLGSSLYKAGMHYNEVIENAKNIIKAYQEAI